METGQQEMGVWWPFVGEQRGECDPASGPTAGRECGAGGEPDSHPHDSMPLGIFFLFFPAFVVQPARREASGVTTVLAGLTQLRFSEKHAFFFYRWPLEELILETEV